MEDIKINRTTKQSNTPEVKYTKKEIPKIKTPEKINKVEVEKTDRYVSQRRISMTPRNNDRKPVRNFLKFFLVISVVLGITFWVGVLFNSAYVTISAKHQNIEYKSRTFSASRDLNSNHVDFEIMIESQQKSRDYVLTESKEVSSKATGSITLFNEFSTKPEKLASGTYISDQDGKTYRLNSTVTIPGYKMDKQKKIPGQIDVGVTSFLAGETYNGIAEKFYINSFKGTTKYSKVYGKPKTELKGGLQGLVYFLTEDDKIKLQHIAESAFKNELFAKVKALLPTGYLLYPGAIKFSYKIEEDVLSDTPEAKIPIEGSLSAVLIKEESMIKNIIRLSLPETTKEEIPEIEIHGLEDLAFNFNNDQQISKDMNLFDFQLTGIVEAIWNPNKENLKAKLLGVHKDNVLPVFRENKGITKAMVRIFPPWNKYLPNNPSKININIR
jgi:hypothetical protein